METQSGSKSIPGRGVTLQMLLEEKMLEPGNAAMTIEYLVSIIYTGLTGQNSIVHLLAMEF